MTGEKRVSVVTGGAAGIGRATVERLAGLGDRVYLLDVDEVAGSEVVAHLDGSAYIRCDVTSEADVSGAVRQISAESGRVDVLVNNAGGFPQQLAIEEITPEIWQRTIDLNLTSVFMVTQAMLPLLRASAGARVINIGSLSGQAPGWRTSPPYAAAKAGVHSLTRVLATDLAEEGITVNAVAPSAVLTNRIRSLRDEDELAATAAGIPLGRYQGPGEVAAWIVFLASPEASFTTGQTISVNGGRFMP
jgi:NAD(P)-dependent dehydrogenase (short-subunit alcohol dehydrogenase family)